MPVPFRLQVTNFAIEHMFYPINPREIRDVRSSLADARISLGAGDMKEDPL
jgi:hypothetical protein